MIDIEAIEKRLNAATPGEWEARDNGSYWDILTTDDRYAGGGIGDVCASKTMYFRSGVIVNQAAENAAFIAHAPQDIRVLLALVKKQREALKTASGIFDTPIARRRINGEYADDAREMIRAALKESTDE